MLLIHNYIIKLSKEATETLFETIIENYSLEKLSYKSNITILNNFISGFELSKNSQ